MDKGRGVENDFLICLTLLRTKKPTTSLNIWRFGGNFDKILVTSTDYNFKSVNPGPIQLTAVYCLLPWSDIHLTLFHQSTIQPHTTYCESHGRLHWLFRCMVYCLEMDRIIFWVGKATDIRKLIHQNKNENHEQYCFSWKLNTTLSQ